MSSKVYLNSHPIVVLTLVSEQYSVLDGAVAPMARQLVAAFGLVLKPQANVLSITLAMSNLMAPFADIMALTCAFAPNSSALVRLTSLPSLPALALHVHQAKEGTYT